MSRLDNQTVLQMNHIMKIYGNGVVANEDVSLELRKGEIHALPVSYTHLDVYKIQRLSRGVLLPLMKQNGSLPCMITVMMVLTM